MPSEAVIQNWGAAMLRRSVIALLTVSAFGVALTSAGISAAMPGGSHAQGSGLHVVHRHFPRHDHRTFPPFFGYGYLPYGGYYGADLSGYTMPDYANYLSTPAALFSMLHLPDPAIALAPSCKHSVETKK